MQRSEEPKQKAAMEEWVLLGESGSDVDSVQFADGSDEDSVSDKGSEMSFTTVQIGGNHRAADALDSSESNGDYGYFDLDLPALAGSKAVFGASGDCFDPNLAASILSMGNVGSDTGIPDADTEDTDSDGGDIDMDNIGAGHGDGIEHPERRACAHCASIDTDQSSDAAQVVIYDDIDTESSDPAESDYDDDTEHSEADMEQPESYSCGRRVDDIDIESLCADDDDDDDIFTESSDADEEQQPESCSRGRHLDDIDTESVCAVDDDNIASESYDAAGSQDEQMMARVRAAMQYIARATPQVSRFVSRTDDKDDTAESFEDAAESNEDDDTESSNESQSDYSDDGTESSDAEESEYSDDGTESTDAEESDYTDDCTEISDEEESDDDNDDTDSSDAEESDYSNDDTEIPVPSGTTGRGDDARNSDLAAAMQRLRRYVAEASTAASPPPTAPHLFFPNAPLFVPNRTGESSDASATKGRADDPSNSDIAAAMQRLRRFLASTSTAASRPPCAPHLYFRNRAD